MLLANDEVYKALQKAFIDKRQTILWGEYMAEKKPIGEVTHFYDQISVAVIKLNSALKVGDKISIVHGENKTEQTVSSMQFDHKAIKEGRKGQEIAIKTSAGVKKGAEVFKA